MQERQRADLRGVHPHIPGAGRCAPQQRGGGRAKETACRKFLGYSVCRKYVWNMWATWRKYVPAGRLKERCRKFEGNIRYIHMRDFYRKYLGTMQEVFEAICRKYVEHV